MALAQAPGGLMPLGGYWRMPEGERDAFRRKVRDIMKLPGNRIPTERQMIFFIQTRRRSLRQPLFFGGAMGGGKSSALCMLAISLARDIPGNRVLMARKEFSAFSGSTLQELEEQLASCSDARHWPGKHEIHFSNGSEIWYMGVGKPEQMQKLGSFQFGAALLDEAPEIEFKTVKMLQTRLRWKPARRANRVVLAMAGNPYPGWIKQDFIANPKEGYTFIPSLATDNAYLAEGYVEDMRAEMPDEWYRAFILGDWNALVPTNSAIPFVSVQKARKRREPKNINDHTVGIDCGHLGTDKTAMASRYGFHFETINTWGQTRIDETIDRCVHELLLLQYLPQRVVIDYDGIGAGVADGLMRKQEDGVLPSSMAIIGLHAQKKATVMPGGGYVNMKYSSAKAQNAFEMRRMLEGNHGDLPDSDELEQDLTTPTYDIVDGQVFIESKKLVRKKLGRSPDLGDAYLLTMWNAGADEIAGLPENMDFNGVNGEILEEAELEKLMRLHALEEWYRSPFGIRQSNNPAPDDLLGY